MKTFIGLLLVAAVANSAFFDYDTWRRGNRDWGRPGPYPWRPPVGGLPPMMPPWSGRPVMPGMPPMPGMPLYPPMAPPPTAAPPVTQQPGMPWWPFFPPAATPAPTAATAATAAPTTTTTTTTTPAPTTPTTGTTTPLTTTTPAPVMAYGASQPYYGLTCYSVSNYFLFPMPSGTKGPYFLCDINPNAPTAATTTTTTLPPPG